LVHASKLPFENIGHVKGSHSRLVYCQFFGCQWIVWYSLHNPLPNFWSSAGGRFQCQKTGWPTLAGHTQAKTKRTLKDRTLAMGLVKDFVLLVLDFLKTMYSMRTALAQQYLLGNFH
jgi:hypothetical protein